MQVVSFATAHFDGNRGWHRRSNGNKPWPTSVILILCIACYAEHDKTRLPCSESDLMGSLVELSGKIKITTLVQARRRTVTAAQAAFLGQIRNVHTPLYSRAG